MDSKEESASEWESGCQLKKARGTESKGSPEERGKHGQESKRIAETRNDNRDGSTVYMAMVVEGLKQMREMLGEASKALKLANLKVKEWGLYLSEVQANMAKGRARKL